MKCKMIVHKECERKASVAERVGEEDIASTADQN